MANTYPFGWQLFHRTTLVADGRLLVSTIGPAPHVPETMIFDNEDEFSGASHYVEYHSTSDDLEKCHEDVVRRFNVGEIVLDAYDND